jgi:LysM repeat protein
MKAIGGWVGIIASVGLALFLEVRAAEASNHTIVYRVRQGDTLQLIAAEFYGDRNKAIFIMVENKIVHAKPLKPGERLRIPVSKDVTTDLDDSWDSLATTHLGDKRRAPFLAEFNNMSPQEKSIPAGTVLHIPFAVTHTAAATETLASISLAYFGEAKHADLLRRYNFLEKSSLERGESISVPVFHVRLPAAKQPPVDADAKKRQARNRVVAEIAAAALPKAWKAWQAGEYDDIENLLSPIELAYTSAKHAAEVHLLLGLVHAAEGKTGLAVEDFKKSLRSNPNQVLRRFEYSPKILQVWEKADGKSE